jgi:hypothetical protein
MSLATGDDSAPDAVAVPASADAAPGACSVSLPDGSPCPAPLSVGSYCPAHWAVGDRDFQVLQLVHEHFEQDLREFWQRSNFYPLVDGS